MDKPVFRMSESGKCARALSAKYLSYEPTPAPKWLETSANEGKWHEDRIIALLEEQGLILIARQEELILDFPSFNLIGHIDGKVIEANLPVELVRLLEIKSMSQFEFDRWMRGDFKEFPQYASQITCYMEATGLDECLYIVKNRNSGFEDRRVLTEKPMHMTEVIAHLTDVTNHILGNQLVPGDFDPQSLECQRCEYKHLCIPEPKELTPIEEAGLSAAAADWRRGRQLISEGEELVNKAREVFEAHTRATNVLKWQHSGLAIQLIHTKRESYEKKELLKLFTLEQLEPALKITEYDQLRINDLETDND